MNSTSRESPLQKRNLNESKNSTILPPEITSTPFVSNKTKIPSPLITPRRKFFGPKRYALSNNGMLNPIKTVKNPPGPLLASTSYNVNVSTYIDTKSPGFAGRLVQYNEESSRKQPNTHQERYGSPGLFPIVHLFKKEIPVISPKIKKGTVQIGSPDSRGYYSQEHNRLLLDGIVRNNSILKEHNNSNEVSTRSVLDALKEISRKRIHVSEEYDTLDENSKKFRKANGEGDYSKRNRVESPPSEKSNSPSITQAKKRLCTIDAVLASKTSSMYANYDLGNKRKTAEDSNNGILPLSKKKFSVQTQTCGTPVIVREMKRTSISRENVTIKIEKPAEETEEVDKIVSESKPVLKVLDDKPLEVIRKNRLGALLSALSGREIPSLPLDDRRKALDQEWPSQNQEKSLVSILSSQNKQAKSTERHVTFDVPESTQFSKSNNPENISASNKEEEQKTDNKSEQNNSPASKSIVEKDKIVENKLAIFNQPSDKDVSNALFKKLDSTKEDNGKPVGGFKFDLTKPLDTQIKKVDVNFAMSSPAPTNLKAMFEASNSDSVALAKNTSLDSSLAKNAATVPSVNSLGLPTSLPSTSFTVSSGILNTSGSFTFENKSTTEAVSGSTDSNEKTKTVLPFGKKGSLQDGFGNLNKTTTTSSIETTTTGKIETSFMNSSTFGSTPTGSSGFAFKGSSMLPSNSTTSLNDSASITPVSPSASCSVPTVSSASAPMTVFPSKSADITASSTTTKSSFGTSISSPGGFKFNSGNSLPAFGSPSVSSVLSTPSTVGSNVFGSPLNIASSTATTQLETPNKTSSLFGSVSKSTSSSSMFGSNSVSNNAPTDISKPFTFGSTNDKSSSNPSTSETTSAFTFKTGQSGVTITSVPSSLNLAFGSAAPSVGNAGSMFSSGKNQDAPPFGTSSTEKPFGTTNSFKFGTTSATSLTTPGSTTALFNTPNTSSLGTSTTFVNTNTTSFGNTNTLGFGAKSTSNPSTSNTLSFGSTNATVNPVNFGTTSTPSFGTTTSTPSFSTPSTLSFGTTSAPSFGTTTALSFGTTSAPSFGTISAPSFGSTSTPSFGTTSAPSFGSTSVPSFGSTSTPSFGTTNAPSFGGSNAPSFGATNTPNFGASNTPNFGSTAAFSTTNTPSFSTSNTSTFNSTNTAGFNSPFGSTSTSNFNTTKEPLFGNGNPSPFGTTNTPSFGSNSTTPATNAFGSTNTPAPSFGTTTSTVFGSTNTASFGNPVSTSSFGTSFSSPSTLSAPSFGNPSTPFGNAVNSNTNAFNSNNTSSPFGNTPGANSFGTFNANNNQFPAVTTASTFGTNTNNTFGSSSTTNAFGSNVTNSAFATPNPTSPFGSNMNSTTSNSFASAFGKKPEQSSSGFPASTTNMFNSSSTFGSAPANNNGAPGGNSSSGVFTFGSANSSNAPSSSNVFTFGAPEPPKSFNFSGPASNVQSPSVGGFNATPSFPQSSAVPNMFSIGSSGNSSSTSQSRGRQLVRARRRT